MLNIVFYFICSDSGSPNSFQEALFLKDLPRVGNNAETLYFPISSNSLRPWPKLGDFLVCMSVRMVRRRMKVKMASAPWPEQQRRPRGRHDRHQRRHRRVGIAARGTAAAAGCRRRSRHAAGRVEPQGCAQLLL